MDLRHYRLAGHRTLTEALESVLKPSGEKKPWIIASLNGQRYFVFRSSATLGQQLYNTAAKKVAVNAAIQSKAATPAGSDLPVPAPLQLRARAHALDDTLDDAILGGWARQDGGAHDAEYLIANWAGCVADYKQHSSHPLKTVDLFMSHSPCTVHDDRPSMARTIEGTRYERSCLTKLKYFVKEHSALKWRLYYREKFGFAADNHWDDARVTTESEWLQLSKLSPDIVARITTVQAQFRPANV